MRKQRKDKTNKQGGSLLVRGATAFVPNTLVTPYSTTLLPENISVWNRSTFSFQSLPSDVVVVRLWLTLFCVLSFGLQGVDSQPLVWIRGLINLNLIPDLLFHLSCADAAQIQCILPAKSKRLLHPCSTGSLRGLQYSQVSLDDICLM